MSQRASSPTRRVGRNAVALFVSVAVIASTVLVSIAPSAFADPPDACSTALVGALDGPSNSVRTWTSGLATVGKLAEGLPGVGTSAGSVLGFTDLVHQWFDNGTTKLNAATSCDNLEIDEPIALGGTDGRAGHLTSHVSDVAGGKRVDVTITAAKTLHDQALGVTVPIGSGSNAPQSGFSSQGGVDLTTTATLGFSLVWQSIDNAVYIVADDSTPSLDVDASAHFANLASVKAAIGILGVEVKSGSTLDLEAHFKATVSDPNGDGKLEFSGGAAELSQPGSLAGLVSFGFANPAGHLDAHLLLGAAAAQNPAPITLPPINATIDVSWPDISTGTPTVTPSGLDAAGAFLNMTPRDLADGIGQLVTSLTMAQRSNIGNLELPFMKGTLADAIQLNESLKKFLKDNTVDPDVDPAQAGHPTFVSLQEFFDRMTTVTVPGTSLTVSNVNAENFGTTSPTISFKVSIDRAAPASPIDLNAAAAAASGGPGTIYTATTLKDPNQHWTANEWANRHVVAGASGATVLSNTTDTITFAVPTTPTVPGQAWSPTVPTNGSPYSISGMDGDVGVVTLGDDLKSSGKGVGQANAVNATAKVTPSYHAEITLVLDLQNPTHHTPPIDVNGDGSTLVSDTPTGADRVKLRTTGAPDLFTADFPINAGVDLFANAGFLQVRLQGAMSVSKKSGATHMLDVALKDNGDLTFHQVVDKLLHHPGDLLDFDIGVAGAGSVTATVPGAPSFFPAAATASFDWGDITTGTPQFDLSGLSKLVNVDFDPTNPKQLFSILLKTLQTLDQALGEGETTGTASIFSQKIPVIGRSLRDLLRADESGMGDTVTYGSDFVQDTSRSGSSAFPSSLVGRSIVVGTQVGIIKSVTSNKLTMFSDWSTAPTTGTAYVVRSELDDVISILQNNPSDNLQALVAVLNARLGHDSPVEFKYDDSAAVGGTPSLVVKLHWKRSFHTSAPVQFDFDLPTLSDLQLVGVQGKGQVSLGAGGEINVGLVVPLAPGDGPADASALKILDDSSIGVTLDASLTNGSLATTIGPLSLSLGDPDNGSTDTVTAKANYSLDLAKPGSTGTAVSFSSFLGAVGPAVNATNTPVTCGLTGETTSTMALCANLPLYISTNSGTSYEPLITSGTNNFAIRLPDTTSPTADYFDLNGAAIDGHPRLETPDAAALAAAIQSHLIDLTRIDGIDGFLNLLIQSLNAASFGGKLPLVGDDLQQGADFLSNLKETIDNAIGGLAGVGSIGGLRDWVNQQLAQQLDDAGLNPDTVKVDTQCSTRVATPGAPTVTTSGTTGTVTRTYAIVAYITTSDGNKLQTKQSPDGSANNGATTLTASNFQHITWGAVGNGGDPVGYMVFKKAGSSYDLLADVGNDVTSYDDKGAATNSSVHPDNPAENPKKTNCAFSDFESVLIRLDVSQGNFSGDTLECDSAPAGHECTTGTVPLDIGIPGLSLRAATPGDGPGYELGWRLHLAFGIGRSQGFFVDTTNVNNQPEFAVGLNLTLPDEINAQLAFINVTAKNCVDTDTANCVTTGPDKAPSPGSVPPAFGGTFKIDILAPNDPTDHHLTLADLSAASLDDLFDVRLFAGVNIDWLLKARPGTDGPIAGFPGIQAELQMKWAWSNAEPGANGTGGGNVPLSIAFQRVQIDAGEIFGGIIGPVVNQIKFVTGPLDPVVKTLYAPIPVLSDLSHLVGGDDVTIISLAKAFSTIAGGPDLTFVDTIAGVVNFINNIPECTTTCLLPIGSFEVAGQKAIDDPATPSNTESFIQNKKDKLGGSAFASVLGDLDGANTKSGAVKLADEQAAGEAKAGFTFPVFENPSSLFNLIMGGDVDLVKFDSGNLRLGFDWNQQFGPVYAPPPVFVTLHGSADVTLRIVAGFDTYGIRKAFEKVRDTGEFNFDDLGNVFLQSLFFYTTDSDGKPLPVVTFHGEIAAGAAVSAVIITVGIEGGVALTISFLWNDPNHDGKFRISEFLQAALNNPICLFSVSGKISVFLRAYVTIGFSPFSVSFSFTIVDVTLLDFSASPDCAPPPPKLGGLTSDGTTLIVYAGALGHEAQRGHSSYESNNEEKDTVKVISLHYAKTTADPDGTNGDFDGIAVEMLGIRREFLNTNIQNVVVVGEGAGVTAYQKPMIVTFIGDGKEDTTTSTVKPPTANFDKTAIVFGGEGADKIKTGIGDSYIDAKGGDDVISTSDKTVTSGTAYALPNAKAVVAGGLGNDSIAVGNGNDTVAGDDFLNVPGTKDVKLKEFQGTEESGNPSHDTTTMTVPDWTQVFGDSGLPSPQSLGADGNDTINAGLGQNNLYGNGGDDTIGIGADNALAATVPGCASGPCDFKSKGATIVGGYGNDHIAGGTGNDAIYTGDKTVTTFDSDGGNDYSTTPTTNTVDTGTGSDTVYGSKGVDIVSGHSIPPHSPATTDTIYGGAANDILVGGYGPDSIFGGPGDDYVIAEPSNVDFPNPPSDDGFGPKYTVTHIAPPAGTVPQFKTLVGGTGRDHIIGGDGGANIDGDKYNDASDDAHSRCIPGTERNPAKPVASDPVDESVNDPADGNDLITGGAGIDNVRAGGGNDTVDAKGNTDRVCGEKDVDTLHGGTEADEVWGGSGGDTIYGDTGADKLYGNADNDTIYGGDQADQIEGNDGVDYGFGGNDADVIVGGTRLAGRNDVGDFLFGDVGSDTIIGDNGVDGGSPSGATVYDLTDGNCAAPATTCAHGGADSIYGGDGTDKAYGGLDNDVVFGGPAFDYIEGNPGADDLNGEAGEDDILGGTSQQVSGSGLGIVGYADTTDTVNGGTNEDVILGDNGAISRPGAGNGSDFTQARNMTERLVTVYDWVNTDASKFGGDTIHGNEQNDVVLGEGGNDTINGDAGNDYLEGNQNVDNVSGDAGQDDILGGSSQVANGAPKTGVTVDGELDAGDVLSGGADQDVILGDNGFILTTGTVGEVFTGTLEDMTKGHAGMTARRINLYDVKDSPVSSTSGDDLITGDANDDVAFGQGGNDLLKGNDGDDHLEGGQGTDYVEGDDGNDDIVGGTAVILTTATATTDAAGGVKDAADVLFGGDGNDVESGDNAVIDRVLVTTPTLHDGANYTTKFTDRLNSDGSAVVTTRWFRRLDLRNGGSLLTAPSSTRFGGDLVSGGSGVDMLFGQDGNDFISGGPHDDYAEGNGGADTIRGDKYLGDAAPTNVFPPDYPSTSDTVVLETTTPTALGVTWPGSPGTQLDLEGAVGPDGQDDLIGGSTLQNFRDGNDTIEGDGEADFELGDNGALVRHYGMPDIDVPHLRHYDVYAERYPDGNVPTNAVVIRRGDATLGMTSTRFCTTSQATCEVTGASAADTMYGDGGDDTMWGQDGNDTMRGGTERDDMYGELGSDTMYGDAGEDAMLGDRGGIVDTLINGSVPPDDAKFTSYTVSQNAPPAVSYTGFLPGTFDRRVDLYHDVNGDVFVGNGTTGKMAHDGITDGGDDRIRGGGGHDSIHAGFGDDLANGDSGGDVVFGDRGGDVLWGGKGCDPNSSEDYDNACTDPSTARGVDDAYVDYLFGGKGGTSAASVNGASGSDLLDWQPRGSYTAGCTPNPWPATGGTKKNPTNLDPCSWFLMTNTYNDTGSGDPASLDPSHADNQTHSGIDWMYGGWDRDVMQADQADEGPNTGDRLLDWSGAYNLYSHCNPSYGGFNDVRQLSPAMITFLQQWGYGEGLGQVNADITTSGTSAYDEVALVYQSDLNQHGVGQAYPSTPGHFDSPNACTY